MSRHRNATAAEQFGDSRDDGGNRIEDYFNPPFDVKFTIVDAKTNEDWKRANERWNDDSGFREFVLEFARKDIAEHRHFNLGYIIESARRCAYLGRDDADYRSNNNLQPAYARLLIRDMPEADMYLDLRRSRFDALLGGGVVLIIEQPGLFDDDEGAVDG